MKDEHKAGLAGGILALGFIVFFVVALDYFAKAAKPNNPPTIEELKTDLITYNQRPEKFYNRPMQSVRLVIKERRDLGPTFKENDHLYLHSSNGTFDFMVEPIGLEEITTRRVSKDEFLEYVFETESIAYLYPGTAVDVDVKLWRPINKRQPFGYGVGFLFGALLLGTIFCMLFYSYTRELGFKVKATQAKIDSEAKETRRAMREEMRQAFSGFKGDKSKKHKPRTPPTDIEVIEPEVVVPEELTEEEAREIMKTSQPASVKLDSTKELHTVQDLLIQTVAEIEEAQNNSAKLTQIIRNKKTQFQDKSWRKLVVSKLEKLETILAVKEVIIKDQELNRELGTAYLDDQIKIKEKENRLAELDANTAEWKKKARDHEKEGVPPKAELKGKKIRERLEEEDAMREEFRIELDKLIDEKIFREERQKKWPDDEKNNSKLADINNQIQKLEMTLKNL